MTDTESHSSPERSKAAVLSFIQMVNRGLRLRCPRCGVGRVFTGLFSMPKHCDGCNLKYEREPGFFLGSIYINYGLTALICAIVYPVLMFNEIVADNVLMPSVLAFSILFPIWFHRYARSLWLAFDQKMDPRLEDDD